MSEEQQKTLSIDDTKKAIIETQMNELQNVINPMLLINGGHFEGKNSKIIEICVPKVRSRNLTSKPTMSLMYQQGNNCMIQPQKEAYNTLLYILKQYIGHVISTSANRYSKLFMF